MDTSNTILISLEGFKCYVVIKTFEKYALGYGNVKQCKIKGGNCVKCISSVPTGKMCHYATKIHVKIHIKKKPLPTHSTNTETA